MELKETEISREYIFRGKILNLRVDEISTADGRRSKREIIEHSGGAGVVALDDEGRLLLVEQYRRPYDEVTLEIPAGKTDEKEEPLSCAARELYEETGATAESITSFGEIYPSPGYTDEVIHLFFAKGLKVGEAHPDDGELLRLRRVSVEDALSMIYSGEIKDAKTVIGIMRCAIAEGKR